MTVSIVKLGAAVLIAIACIIGLILDASANRDWAVPILTLLVGYVIGNAQVTDNSPIVTNRDQ